MYSVSSPKKPQTFLYPSLFIAISFNLKLRYSTEREDISFNQILRCEGLTTLLLSVKIQPQISESPFYLAGTQWNGRQSLIWLREIHRPGRLAPELRKGPM